VTASFGVGQEFANNFGPDALATLQYVLADLVRARRAAVGPAACVRRGLVADVLTCCPSSARPQTGLPTTSLVLSADSFYVDMPLLLEGPTLTALSPAQLDSVLAVVASLSSATVEQLSLLNVTAPVAAPPAPSIGFRRSSRKMLLLYGNNGIPVVQLMLRCMLGSAIAGDDFISTVGVGIASDASLQALAQAGVPVAFASVPNFLLLDPWVNVTVFATVGPDLTGGGAMAAAAAGVALVDELADAVASLELSRQLESRGYNPSASALLVAPVLELLEGFAPPPSPPRAVALRLPPAPPMPLMPVVWQAPPPAAPPPAPKAPRAEYKPMIAGQPAALVIGLAAGIGGGVAVCGAGCGFLLCAPAAALAALLCAAPPG
jgi:hypothetical protein